MEVIKTVVSGLGRIGWQFHIPSILENKGFNLTGVCDPLEDRRREASEAFSVNCYADFETMLDTEKPGLVVIASPTHLHAEQAICAMERGCDVFLDKPMARDLAEAERINEAKNRTGRKLMMYQPTRANAATQLLKKAIESGLIGDVFMIKKSCLNFVHRNDWQAFKKYGGGMLNNYGAHQIDAALYLSGSTAKKVSGHMLRIASAGDADDVVKVLIETQNNISLDIDINMAAAINQPETTVYGCCGTIVHMASEEGEYFHARYFEPEEQTSTKASDSLAAANRRYVTAAPAKWHEKDFPIKEDESVNYYDKCYEYYALDAEPFVCVSETMEVMRVIHECRKYSGWSQDE